MPQRRFPKRAQNILQEHQSPPNTSYSLIPTKQNSRGSQKPSIQSCIFVADGQTVTQDPNLPVQFRQVGFQELPLQNAPTNSRHTPQQGDQAEIILAAGEGEGDPMAPPDLCYKVPATPSANTKKRAAQAAHWETDVIPRLLMLYIELLRNTKNLHDEPRPKQWICTCPLNHKSQRRLEITIVKFYTLSKIVLEVCECSPAPIQLEEHGLFPCFTNALQWYNSLRLSTKQFVDDILTGCRGDIRRKTEPYSYDNDPLSSSPSYPPDSSPASSQPASPLPSSSSYTNDGYDYDNKATRKWAQFVEEDLRPQPQVLLPSEYLRTHCPLCFGGTFYGNHALEFDAIVCIDACFTQKHNKTKSARDPPKKHPDTVFVPEADMQVMEDFVESVRGARVPEEVDDKDSYDPGLQVPRSALNGCEASFTAADERHTKSSTQFFDSTALMAMMCRHDRVLWLANMTSAGEKQHYVLALIETLFKNLPSVSDCVKWDFLVEHLEQLGFAVLVFHAFGHNWPCQLIYHPRKQSGFGLSDGKGCERFWHSISHLIPYLRVCGYHQRLYTLDTQIQHANKESLLKLGSWLRNKWSNAHGRLSEARKTLNNLGLKKDYLREQWEEQVHEQTQPQPKQNKNKGKKAVEEVLALRENRELMVQKVEELEEVLLDLESPDYKRAEAGLKLPETREKLKSLERRLRSKELMLGVAEDQRVQHLLNSPFLKHQMNTLALKTRLIGRLRACKFKHDRLERSFWKQLNDQKVHSQISQSLKRREPGIQSLARDYNLLVAKMQDLIKRKRAPCNAMAPEKIPMDRLFMLDVDNGIWQDVGLTDKYDNHQPPAWLANDSVRTGIRAMLERDHSLEEIERLSHERDAMQQWFADEWGVLMRAIDETPHPNVSFQLCQRRSELLELCWRWRRSVGTIASAQHTPAWGPSNKEIQRAGLDIYVENLPMEDLDVYPEGAEVDYGSEGSEQSDLTDYDEDEFNVVEAFDVLDLHTLGIEL
ncbi:hypothetical protein V5O48_015526 [Marasmius crinis-equi]|uniref:CxC1-like cysteine cluster associated with KDZ transposases domain-containing protein n=1 Tax=Marasmius crinis-equi TaxID=585013 RepID=A0ABR3EUA2_9AGAR